MGTKRESNTRRVENYESYVPVIRPSIRSRAVGTEEKEIEISFEIDEEGKGKEGRRTNEE